MTLQQPITVGWVTPPPDIAAAELELEAVLLELAQKRQQRRDVVSEILELESDRRYLREFIVLHQGLAE